MAHVGPSPDFAGNRLRSGGLNDGRLEAARMKTSEECTAKALELDAKATEAPMGSMRNGYVAMAAHWRLLAVTAAQQEALAAR